MNSLAGCLTRYKELRITLLRLSFVSSELTIMYHFSVSFTGFQFELVWMWSVHAVLSSPSWSGPRTPNGLPGHLSLLKQASRMCLPTDKTNLSIDPFPFLAPVSEVPCPYCFEAFMTFLLWLLPVADHVLLFSTISPSFSSTPFVFCSLQKCCCISFLCYSLV